EGCASACSTKSSSWGGDSRERCSQLGDGPDGDVEVLSRGAGGDRNRSWRAAIPVPIVGNGSGTEVSSLTADYQRSRGCGTEEASGSPGVGAEHPPRWPSFAFIARSVSSASSRGPGRPSRTA